jgi:hypothetical protein
MARLKMDSICTSHFTYLTEERSFIAEASDLPGRGRFRRIYDDSCDLGLTLRSQRTGREVDFALFREVRDGSGEDIMHWELRPICVTSDLKDLKVIVFND